MTQDPISLIQAAKGGKHSKHEKETSSTELEGLFEPKLKQKVVARPIKEESLPPEKIPIN